MSTLFLISYFFSPYSSLLSLYEEALSSINVDAQMLANYFSDFLPMCSLPYLARNYDIFAFACMQANFPNTMESISSIHFAFSKSEIELRALVALFDAVPQILPSFQEDVNRVQWSTVMEKNVYKVLSFVNQPEALNRDILQRLSILKQHRNFKKYIKIQL